MKEYLITMNDLSTMIGCLLDELNMRMNAIEKPKESEKGLLPACKRLVAIGVELQDKKKVMQYARLGNMI
jgi:hypothetical protein